MVDVESIKRVARRIDGRVRRTPLVTIEAREAGLPVRCLLKLELLQYTGSCKPRGVFNLLLTRRPGTGVVIASGGNAGLAVAYACRELDWPRQSSSPRARPRSRSTGSGRWAPEP